MIIIGISGGTGSGKTTLAKKIYKIIKEKHAVYIKHDSYYKDQSKISLKDRKKLNYDLPEALENELLINHLKKLAKGKCIEKPIYDFSTHTRKNEGEVVLPRDIIILEGILIYGEKKLRDLIDLKIFIDIEVDIRLCRRIMRDLEERGRDINSILNQWLETAQPMYKKYIHPTKKYADIIYKKDPTKEEIDNLVTKIRNLNVS